MTAGSYPKVSLVIVLFLHSTMADHCCMPHTLMTSPSPTYPDLRLKPLVLHTIHILTLVMVSSQTSFWRKTYLNVSS